MAFARLEHDVLEPQRGHLIHHLLRLIKEP